MSCRVQVVDLQRHNSIRGEMWVAGKVAGHGVHGTGGRRGGVGGKGVSWEREGTGEGAR